MSVEAYSWPEEEVEALAVMIAAERKVFDY
jgi:hypothetical protein